MLLCYELLTGLTQCRRWHTVGASDRCDNHVTKPKLIINANEPNLIRVGWWIRPLVKHYKADGDICKSLFDPEIIWSGDDFLTLGGCIDDIMSLGVNREKFSIIAKWPGFWTDLSTRTMDFPWIIFVIFLMKSMRKCQPSCMQQVLRFWEAPEAFSPQPPLQSMYLKKIKLLCFISESHLLIPGVITESALRNYFWWVQKTLWVLGIEFGLTACKPSALSTMLSLQPQKIEIFFQIFFVSAVSHIHCVL